MGEKNASPIHDRILEQALLVFSLKGYADATIKEISEAAGCNAITVFRHFENKENLFYSVVERFHRIEVPEERIRSKLGGSNISKDIATIADIFFKLIFRHIHILRIFINEGAYFPKIHKYMWLIPDSMKSFFIDYLGEIYPDAIRTEDAALIAEMFVAYITRQCSRYSVHCGIHEYSGRVAEDFRTGSRDQIEQILGMIASVKKTAGP